MEGLEVIEVSLHAAIVSLMRQQDLIARGLESIEAALRDINSPKSAWEHSEAAPLAVTLNLRGAVARTVIEVWVKSSAPADFEVEGSRNGTDFRTLSSISITDPAGGEKHEGFLNAYPVIRVSTAAANTNQIEIVAAG